MESDGAGVGLRRPSTRPLLSQLCFVLFVNIYSVCFDFCVERFRIVLSSALSAVSRTPVIARRSHGCSAN